jgi:hypothetical protein
MSLEGTDSIQEFWGVTSGPWYPGQISRTVAPEPTVELVAGAGNSTVGETGSHMVL